MWPDFESPLVTAPILARRLRTSVGWVKQEAEAGRLPCVKADRQFLFDRRIVEQVLLERAACGIPLAAPAPCPADPRREGDRFSPPPPEAASQSAAVA